MKPTLKEIKVFVPVSVEINPPEQVLVHVIYEQKDGNKSGVEIAFYTKGGIVEFDDEDDVFPECYDEEAGCSYLSEGFWTTKDEYEEKVSRIMPTHWLKEETKIYLSVQGVRELLEDYRQNAILGMTIDEYISSLNIK